MANIEELIDKINEEHRYIIPRGPEQLEHAIRCGELLIQARTLVPKGHWVLWLDENVEVFRTTAFKYIRLAQHKDQIQGKFSGIDPAIDFLAGKRQLTPDEKHEIVALATHKTFDEVAEMMDVSKSTVSYYVNAKDRNRVKGLQKQRRTRERQALQREQDAKLVRGTAGQELQDAYALLRRSEQRLQQAIDAEKDWHVRRILSEALYFFFKGEDKIVEALKNR